MLQKNPEDESVRDQQKGYNQSRNEVGRAQLSRHEPGIIGLIERVQEICQAPTVEDPGDHNASPAWQQYQ
jgi:hypothetical protein